MKYFGLTLVISLLHFAAFTQNDLYTNAMEDGLNMLQQAQGQEGFLDAANKFERIAVVEKDRWHPSYYTAYARIIAATMDPDPAKREEILDNAQSFLDKTKALEHLESEVLTLQGFLYMIRIGVDPASRGQEYSGLSAASLQKAMAHDPGNPRTLYILAQLTYGTAQFFGSDSTEACKLNEQALEKFKLNDETGNEDPFAPTWGKRFAESFHTRCDH